MSLKTDLVNAVKFPEIRLYSGSAGKCINSKHFSCYLYTIFMFHYPCLCLYVTTEVFRGKIETASEMEQEVGIPLRKLRYIFISPKRYMFGIIRILTTRYAFKHTCLHLCSFCYSSRALTLKM